MITTDNDKSGQARRDYVEPQLVNYGSIVDATGSFISDGEGHHSDTRNDLHSY